MWFSCWWFKLAGNRRAPVDGSTFTPRMLGANAWLPLVACWLIIKRSLASASWNCWRFMNEIKVAEAGSLASPLATGTPPTPSQAAMLACRWSSDPTESSIPNRPVRRFVENAARVLSVDLLSKANGAALRVVPWTWDDSNSALRGRWLCRAPRKWPAKSARWGENCSRSYKESGARREALNCWNGAIRKSPPSLPPRRVDCIREAARSWSISSLCWTIRSRSKSLCVWDAIGSA